MFLFFIFCSIQQTTTESIAEETDTLTTSPDRTTKQPSQSADRQTTRHTTRQTTRHITRQTTSPTTRQTDRNTLQPTVRPTTQHTRHLTDRQTTRSVAQTQINTTQPTTIPSSTDTTTRTTSTPARTHIVSPSVENASSVFVGTVFGVGGLYFVLTVVILGGSLTAYIRFRQVGLERHLEMVLRLNIPQVNNNNDNDTAGASAATGVVEAVPRDVGAAEGPAGNSDDQVVEATTSGVTNPVCNVEADASGYLSLNDSLDTFAMGTLDTTVGSTQPLMSTPAKDAKKPGKKVRVPSTPPTTRSVAAANALKMQ